MEIRLFNWEKFFIQINKQYSWTFSHELTDFEKSVQFYFILIGKIQINFFRSKNLTFN